MRKFTGRWYFVSNERIAVPLFVNYVERHIDGLDRRVVKLQINSSSYCNIEDLAAQRDLSALDFMSAGTVNYNYYKCDPGCDDPTLHSRQYVFEAPTCEPLLDNLGRAFFYHLYIKPFQGSLE